MSIEVRHLTKRFGSFAALDDVSIHFPAGELVALLGPSGSGKTTLLRVIAGLEHADAGEVLFEGEDASKRSARDRRVGFVFQHYALFRHMSVFENVAFGLRVKPRAEAGGGDHLAARVRHLHAIGRVVRVELVDTQHGELMEAELTRERFRDLGLQVGEQVYVRAREVQVYAEDYSI